MKNNKFFEIIVTISLQAFVLNVGGMPGKKNNDEALFLATIGHNNPEIPLVLKQGDVAKRKRIVERHIDNKKRSDTLIVHVGDDEPPPVPPKDRRVFRVVN